MICASESPRRVVQTSGQDDLGGCPANGRWLPGQPQLVEKALTGPCATLVTLTENKGTGEHNEAGAMSRAHPMGRQPHPVIRTRPTTARG
jgi:hypothetical protein